MTVATSASFYVDQVDEVTILCFTVRSLTEQNHDFVADDLLEFVALVTAERSIRVVVELSSIDTIDELGLAMLQAFSDSIDDAGGRLVLCRVQPRVITALRRSGPRCEIARTRGEAIDSF